jgi:hypothetical protein
MRTMAGLGYLRFEHLSAAAFQKRPVLDLDDVMPHSKSAVKAPSEMPLRMASVAEMRSEAFFGG